MKRVIFSLNVLLLLISGVFFTNKNVSANELESGLPFYVEPIFPVNQDKNIDYYISVTSDSDSLKQDFEFLITNITKQKQVIDVKLLNAYTSSKGQTDYQEEETHGNLIIDDVYELKKYIETPKKVELQGGESKIIRLKGDFSNIEGTVLGAVTFSVNEEKQNEKKEGLYFKIEDKLRPILGIAVNFSSSQKYKFEFGKPYVEPMPAYFVVRLPITLSSPVLLKGIDINYAVYFKGKKLFFDKKEIDFAPMTRTNFSIPFDYEEIEKEKLYTLKGALTYKDKHGVEQKQDFEFEFEYVAEKEHADNPISKVFKIPLEKSDLSSWLLLPIVLLLALIVFLRLHAKKQSEQFVIFAEETILDDTLHDFQSEFVKLLQPKKDAVNTDGLPYVHYYQRKKTKSGSIVYLRQGSKKI